MQPDAPASAPIEELAPADPGELSGPAAREQSPLDEPGQGPELQVVAQLLGRASQDLRQLVRDLDRDVHARNLPDSVREEESSHPGACAAAVSVSSRMAYSGGAVPLRTRKSPK